MKYVIGIDLGTNAVKAALIDEYGHFIDASTKPYRMSEPDIGFAEQSPETWDKSTQKALKELTQRNSEKLSSLLGISYSGQMHGLVMLDEKYDVIRPSIIWCDQRSNQQVLKMKKLMPDSKWLEITGNVPSTGLTAAKLLWVKENEPQSYKKCKHILLPKDYVRFTMTNILNTEITDASGTQLRNLEHLAWSKTICDALEISINLLPKILKSTDIAGYITKEYAQLSGLPTGLPVIAGAADQPASAIGNGIIKEGIISDTLGSSGVVFAMSESYKYDQMGRVNTFCHCVDNTYAIMGVTQSCGLSVNWLAREFYKNEEEPFDRINKDIAPLDKPGNLIFLPYLMGERTPILDPKSKGIIFGLTHATNRKHIAQAVLEGVSFSQFDALRVLQEMGISEEVIKVAGGGSKSKIWTQMLSDIFGCEIEKNINSESSILGAAIIAFVGVKHYKTWESAIKKMIQVSESRNPSMKLHKEYLTRYLIYKKLYINLKELF